MNQENLIIRAFYLVNDKAIGAGRRGDDLEYTKVIDGFRASAAYYSQVDKLHFCGNNITSILSTFLSPYRV